MKKDELYKNQFIETNAEFVLLVHKNLKNRKYENLSNFEKYIIDISKHNNNLLAAIKEIEYVVTFLKRFPLKSFFKDNDVNEIEYIKYHIEVYYHKLFTISELLKLLINRIYLLGLDERKCNSENLMKKLGDKNPVIIVLKDFDKNHRYYRRKRTKSVHYGDFVPDKDFDDISLFSDFHSVIEETNGQLQRGDIPKSVVDYMIKKYRREQVKTITKNISGIRKFINIFYNIWINVYFEKMEEMSNT